MRVIINLFLFLLDVSSLCSFNSFYFYFICLTGEETFEVLIFVFIYLIFIAFEIWFSRWFSLEQKIENLIMPVLVSNLPMVLGWALPWVQGWVLPKPHNFSFRNIQIFLGLMLVSHLFLFFGWLLWKVKKNKKLVVRNFAWIAVFLLAGLTLSTVQCDLSGDEPHYLLMAYSLIHDGDLDLSNNYQNKDYENFYHRGALEPQALEHVVDGKRYSHHPLGPVLLVLPGFALLGRLGATLTMALLTALALYLTLRVMKETGAKGMALWAVGAIGLFSSPLLLFSGLIYPEIPTACLVAISLLLYIKKRWGWFGLAQGAMLWMHNRNVLLVIPFLLFAAWEIWKNQHSPFWLRFFKKDNSVKNIGKLLLGFAAPVIALTAYFFYLYGVFSPLGAHNEPFTSLFRSSHFWAGFFGLVLDQECGLWFHFPIFAMAVTGGVILLGSKDPLRFLVVGTFAFYYLFMSFYENLGLTPATRYMVGVTPLLLLMLYPALERMKKWDFWMILTAFSFALGVLVNWILAAVPWMRYNKLDGENWMLKIASSFLHMPLPSFEPAFNPPVIEAKSYFLGAFWVVMTIVLTILFLITESKNKRKDESV